MKHLLKNISLFSIFGMIYTNIELFFRNKTDVRMFFVGGLCGLLVGLINEIFPKMRIIYQAFLSTIIILSIEFVSGYYFNIIKGLNIWNYSDMPFNIMGQICLPFGIIWFFLSILCIYVDDLLRYKLFDEEKPISLKDYLKSIFKKRK